jgi:hypothetical protein
MRDIAWAAGVFEGEGSINRHNLRVAQKDHWLLVKLQALFGGSVYPRAACSEWHLSGSRARGFALTIFSFMSPRRKAQLTGMLDRAVRRRQDARIKTGW